VCTIELVDEAGTAIQATMWKAGRRRV